MRALPSVDEFRRGYKAFQNREPRDAMYKTASFLVEHFWGKPADIADSLGVLLLTWNQAFYRYGPFDFGRVEEVVASEQGLLDSFRKREIRSYSVRDDALIAALFGRFLKALRLCEGKKKGTSSPVAVAKALHLLAPQFFPLWDAAIARAYGCAYAERPAAKYLAFLAQTKDLVDHLAAQGATGTEHKSLIKLVDEYNYAKFTKKWI